MNYSGAIYVSVLALTFANVFQTKKLTMSVDYKNRFKRQLRVQLCRTCIEYKQQRDYYMKRCKYYENLVAEYQNKNANTETSPVETEVAQPELYPPHGTEDPENDAEQRIDDENISISNWNNWQFLIPKIEPPDSPSPEPIDYDEPIHDDEPESADENVTVSEMEIFTTTSEEPEVQLRGPTEDNPEDANKIKMCRWMLEDQDGVLHMCGDVFASARELSTHVSGEHVAWDKGKGYVCQWRDCDNNGRPFKLRNTLITHLATHTGDNPYRCTYPGCVEEFACRRDLRWHVEIHTRRFECKHPNCFRTYVTQRAMQIHYNKRHTRKNITPVPPKRSKPVLPTLPVRGPCNYDFLKFHEELSSNREPNKCEFPGCNRAFPRPEDRDAHLSAHRTMLMRTKDYACAFEGCARRFANQKVLDKHFASHAPREVDPLIEKQQEGGDDEGNCSPEANGDAQVHAEPETPPQELDSVPSGENEEPDSVPTGENDAPQEPEIPKKPPGRRETCFRVCRWQTDNGVFCGVTLGVEDLLTHVSENHAGLEDSTRHVCMWHDCDRTDRVFFFKRELMTHIRAHVCGELFRCRSKKCGQWFLTEPELSQHRRGHDVFRTARPKLTCPHKQCPRMFWNEEYLERHLVNKHTPKEYRCPEESCGMVFKTLERMKEHHMRVHKGVEMFKCAEEGCGRSFNCRNHLVRHVRLLHLQEKPFRCTAPGCNMEFAYPTTYETHRKTHSGASQ